MKVCEHLDRLIEVLNFVAKGVMSKTEPSTRRELRFESLDEVLADVEILVSGGHRTVGNWTLAQILTHLQKTFDASIDGFGFESNWLIRKVLGPLFKKRFLTNLCLPVSNSLNRHQRYFRTRTSLWKNPSQNFKRQSPD